MERQRVQKRCCAPCDPLEKLIVSVARGCPSAFAYLHQGSRDLLFGIVLRILHDRDAAEETLQQVFLTVWTQSKRYDPSKGTGRSWLQAIARNAGIDALRKRRLNSMALVRAAAEERAASSAVQPPARFELGADLEKAIEYLPDRQRQAIDLFFRDDLSVAEVAEKMLVPPNTAKSWIRRAVLKLRREARSRDASDYF